MSQKPKTVRERILRSAIVQRGDIFTASDMADALEETKASLSNMLNNMWSQGDLYLVEKGKPSTGRQARYVKQSPGRYILSRKWDKNLRP